MNKIYLAIPYSFNPIISFEIANMVAAKLMSENNLVFSPISHTHHVADYLDEKLRTDSLFWMIHDLPFVEWADELHVVVIKGEVDGYELIAQSKGVQMEIEHAKKFNKPIKYIFA